MRSFVSAIVCLVLLFIGGFLYTASADHISKNMMSEVDKISYSIKNNAWDNAIKQYKSFNESYHKKQSKLYLLLNHERISAIDLLVDGARTYVENHDKPNALAYLSMLRYQFLDIPQEQYISFENIL